MDAVSPGALPTLYKARGLATKQPVCAICVERTRGKTQKIALGYGVGARVRSPLGPFRVDLAYGQEVHKFRVHLSIGLTF